MPTVESRLAAVERQLRFRWLVIAGLLIALVVLGSCDADKKSQTDREERERTAHDARVSGHLAQLAQKHGAIADWREKLHDYAGFFPGTLYTIELEDAIVRTGGRPITFVSPLFDVRRQENVVQMVFARGVGADFPRITFVLNCPTSFLDRLGSLPAGPTRVLFEFAVVAQIKSVNKVLFEVSSSTVNDIFDDDGRARPRPLRLEPSTDWFVAQGTCVEVGLVPD